MRTKAETYFTLLSILAALRRIAASFRIEYTKELWEVMVDDITS